MTVVTVPPATPTATRTATPAASGGGVQGVVRDAATGRALAGATVAVAGGASATTDSNGRYTLSGLNPGQTQLSATASGYVADRAAVAVPTSGAATLAFALSAALPEGQYRIILTWGDQPRDLDSHLYVPLGSETAEVYFGSRGALSARPYATLDVDDTSGLGTETITVGQLQRGRYTYAVYQFSADGTLAQSGARVQVIRGSSVVQTFTVPARQRPLVDGVHAGRGDGQHHTRQSSGQHRAAVSAAPPPGRREDDQGAASSAPTPPPHSARLPARASKQRPFSVAIPVRRGLAPRPRGAHDSRAGPCYDGADPFGREQSWQPGGLSTRPSPLLHPVGQDCCDVPVA